MPYNKDSSVAFTGGTGQMAVMAELLHRKCNAAIPVIDIGTDVFAFRDDREELARIQVKTATGKPRNKGSADFRIPIDQLGRTDDPALFYVLAVRLEDGWGSMIVISRPKLQELREEGCGTEIENKKTKKFDSLKMYITFRDDEVEGIEAENAKKLKAQCNGIDLTKYLNAWECLPPLKPPVPVDPPGAAYRCRTCERVSSRTHCCRSPDG